MLNTNIMNTYFLHHRTLIYISVNFQEGYVLRNLATTIPIKSNYQTCIAHKFWDTSSYNLRMPY